MTKVIRSAAIAIAMILLAVAEARGVISDKASAIAFYGLLGAAVVVLGGGKCAAIAR